MGRDGNADTTRKVSRISDAKPEGPPPKGEASGAPVVRHVPAWNARLSVRENEILALIAGGHRNYEISTLLSISTRTVEKHVEKILRKLKVKNRSEAVGAAFEKTDAPAAGTLLKKG